jgi:thiol:disulfide interchange protein DsbG
MMISARRQAAFIACAGAMVLTMTMNVTARAQTVMTGSDLSIIDKALAQTPGIKLLRTFPGPGGLTGMLMSVRGKKMVAYLTPGGRYMIEGVVMNIATGQNVTAADAAQYAGSGVIPMAQDRITKLLSEIETMAGISTDKNASNAVYLVFDPSTQNGQRAFRKMWSASLSSRQNITYDFVPFGSPIAGWLLSGTHADQMNHLREYDASPSSPPLAGGVTEAGNRLASANSLTAARLAVRPPLLGLVLPSLRIENIIRAVPGKSLDRGGIAQAGVASAGGPGVATGAQP